MLKVVNANKNEEPASKKPLKSKRLQAEATFERLWLRCRDKFNPYRNYMETLRIERTLNLLKESLSLKNLKAADLGSGFGEISLKMRDAGATVDAVDIASAALDRLKEEKDIFPIQDLVPYTTLKDDAYDLVLSTELIAYLAKSEYRLYFSELARLVKREGHVVCSTLIDIYSDDAIEQFAAYAETEFDIEKWVLSYHYLWTKLLFFFQAPEKYVKASKDEGYRASELAKRNSFFRFWFNLQSSFWPSMLWRAVAWVIHPILLFIKKSRYLLLTLESISKFIWQKQGISHAIFLAKRRPLFTPPPEDQRPIERKTKKVVWE